MGENYANTTAIDLVHGTVLLVSTYGDLDFESSSDGTPEIIAAGGGAVYSTDVAAANASQKQCQTATSSDPDANPITNFHKGLLFCAETNNLDIALEETQPLGSDHILHLHEIFWPNPNS